MILTMAFVKERRWDNAMANIAKQKRDGPPKYPGVRLELRLIGDYFGLIFWILFHQGKSICLPGMRAKE